MQLQFLKKIARKPQFNLPRPLAPSKIQTPLPLEASRNRFASPVSTISRSTYVSYETCSLQRAFIVQLFRQLIVAGSEEKLETLMARLLVARVELRGCARARAYNYSSQFPASLASTVSTDRTRRH